MRKFLFPVLLLCFSLAKGQSDFSQVYDILQTNCASPSCHGGTNPLSFLGSKATVYSAITNKVPTNPAAIAAGYKLIDPGHPYNSYLLKKIGNTMDSYLALKPAEGNQMPSGQPALSNYDIEIVRQWVLHGAKFNSLDIDTNVIWEYYNVGGLPFNSAPDPPAAGEGFQVRLGPIFVDKLGSGNEEREYLKKEQLNLPGDMEVTNIEGVMNTQSHHFLLFAFDDSASAAAEDNGLRLVNLANNAFDGNKQFTSAWQFSETFNLPSTTAFFWDKRDVLDLNYHFKNYSNTDVLPVDFYLNVYTQPRGSGNIEMRAELVNNALLLVPQGVSTANMSDNGWGDGRRIWMISSHTHKYGKDFDIYVRNPNGSNGDQIYEGFFSADYGFNQGFYDWQHPAIRIFDTLYRVASNEGLNFVTDYDNTGPSAVTFGLTTADEMQLSTYLYVNESEAAVAIDQPRDKNPFLMTVFPNPARGNASVGFTLPTAGEVKVELMGIRGERIATLADEHFIPGQHLLKIDLQNATLPEGMYFVSMEYAGKRHLEKLVIIR